MIFEGTVVEGNRIGRTIGFPTANIETEPPGELPSGVFACHVWLPASASSAPARVSHTASRVFYGMLNIGIRPTLSAATPRTIEVHIFDFRGDLYGTRLRVEIVKKIRDEQKFPSLSALQARLEQDKTAARKIFEAEEKR